MVVVACKCVISKNVHTFSFLIFLLIISLTGCQKDAPLFVLLDSKKTGIEFNNDITEYDSLSILNSEFIYNGGGVGIGDLNGDGLPDIYFTGNQVLNKLYLNKGNLRFEDITEQAKAQKYPGQWSSGINILDINRDGKQDIYVCNTFDPDPEKRKNLLFINQGNDANGVPQFVEMAAAYGIADTTHSSNAQFFDYDNDGDLDLFIGTNIMDTRYPNQYHAKVTDGSSLNRDVLYRNDWDETAGHPVFTDVSREAGLLLAGYSHSSLIADFNEDGWLDIYVANDYITNDLIYINNHDGTFTNQVANIFKHQAASAMGSDVADVNNDGKLDFFTTEMLPYYNKRKKLFLNANNYNNYINNEALGYEYQYARNTLQVNRGLNPENGLPVFSEVAFLSSVQETEWSWAPLIADLDNDGLRDIFVTNGFPRDVTDHDFGAFRSTTSYLIPPLQLQDMIPQIKVPKFAFKNEGDLRFSDYSKQWGVDVRAFTNGAAYGDLDNDGDLDLVLNNIDDKAFVFKNTLNDGKQKDKNNYLRIKVKGTEANPDAFGAVVTAFFDGKAQSSQLVSGRGYISTSENIAHFGLGKVTQVDSVIVRWGETSKTKVTDLPLNQMIVIELTAAEPATLAQVDANSIFEMIDPTELGLNYVPRDSDFIDFDYQKTLPHKFSQYGPSAAVGDANGDGLDDIYISGSAMENGMWLLQTPDGQFIKKPVAYKNDPGKREEELGTLLFDADGDGDNDLYIVRGSYQYEAGSSLYRDVLCVNDGKGNFAIAPDALPKNAACGQAVKAADFDGDGDLDLFVGGRVLPRAFPKTDKSFILRNDSKNKDKPVFTDVTAEVFPELTHIGLISDAIWTDFNNDNLPDLILAGEWMPLTFLQNQGGTFKNVTAETGIQDKLGWWTSLAAGDFDNDGDIDYIAGNFGENIYFRCNGEEPLTLYANDFDKNGLYDPFISCFWQDSLGNRKEYFYHTRDDMIKQLILIRRKFQTYAEFGNATAPEVFTEAELEGAQILKTNWMYTSFVENLGGGKFQIRALPMQAQLAPVFGILPYDIDQDGLLDIMMVGNDFGMELMQGRADASYGLVLKNNGNNQFRAIELEESHFYVPGDARALTRVTLANQQEIILATQNRAPLKVFKSRAVASRSIALNPHEVKAQITYKNGAQQIREFSWGSTFLSQESRSISFTKNIMEITFFDIKNNPTRKITENGESL